MATALAAAATADLEQWLGEYRRVSRERPGEPSWLADLRAAAIERFEAMGFPTTRDEEWKYTNAAPIAQTRFGQHAAADVSLADAEAPTGPAQHKLVFVNGSYRADLSSAAGMPDGVTASSLSDAVEHQPELVRAHLARYARFDRSGFTALNTALAQDGAFIHVPRGIALHEPIHVAWLAAAGAEPVAAHPRILIVAEEHSQATVVEAYASLNPETVTFTNAVAEVNVGEGAVVEHYKVQTESERAYHVSTQQSEQGSSSVFSSCNVALGGAVTRNDVNARLGGEGGEATLNGLYAPHGRQHVDNHTAIDHAMPHCNSHELYKGIMDGRATAVFNGKIFVRQDAQKTDAKQTNQNILLSDDAAINTKPQLEIFADDVRCTHGATVGQLDAEALFYLRSRGIGLHEARTILVHAFAGDLLSRVKPQALRERLEALLLARLGGS